MKELFPVLSERAPDSQYWEVFLALGPNAIGDTRENRLLDLIGRVWLMVWDREDSFLRVFRREEGGEWTPVTALLPPLFADAQPSSRRRFSFAFDQSARVIVAYEEADEVFLTRWDPAINQYVQNVTFAGHDPVVVFDATWAYYIPVSDVLLFYLSPDRTKLMCRVQRDLYAVEYELHDYGQPVVLDRVTRLPLRYQMLASDAAGEPLADSGQRVGLLSGLYPYPAFSEATATLDSGPTEGEYQQVVIPYEAEDSMTSVLVSGPTAGSYLPPVIEYEADDTMTATLDSPTAGAYVQPVIARDEADSMTATLASGPDAGLYELVVIEVGEDNAMTATLASGPTGGTYATP